MFACGAADNQGARPIVDEFNVVVEIAGLFTFATGGGEVLGGLCAGERLETVGGVKGGRRK